MTNADDIWHGKDQDYRIGDMTDQHVLNAERFTRRQIDAGEESLIGAERFYATLQGEIACYTMENEINLIIDRLADTRYAHERMLKEVHMRGLTPLR